MAKGFPEAVEEALSKRNGQNLTFEQTQEINWHLPKYSPIMLPKNDGEILENFQVCRQLRFWKQFEEKIDNWFHESLFQKNIPFALMCGPSVIEVCLFC